MAISTGDIQADAITELVSKLSKSNNRLTINLDKLCFIFNVTNEPNDADAKDNFQDMYDWFVAQEWASTATPTTGSALPAQVSMSWLNQEISFKTGRVYPSTAG